MTSPRIHLLGLALLGVCANVAVAKEPKSQVVTIAGASVTLPGSKLRTEVQQKSVSTGTKPGQVIVVETDFWEVGDVVYQLTVATLPEPLRDAPADMLLDGVQAGIVGPDGQGGILADRKEIEVNSAQGPIAGRAIRIIAGNRSIRARFTVVEGRIYQLTAASVSRLLDRSEVTDALNSFVIGPAPSP